MSLCSPYPLFVSKARAACCGSVVADARWRPLAKPISVHLGKHRLVSGLVCSVQFNLPAPPPLIDRTYFSLSALIYYVEQNQSSALMLTGSRCALLRKAILFLMMLCCLFISIRISRGRLGNLL